MSSLKARLMDDAMEAEAEAEEQQAAYRRAGGVGIAGGRQSQQRGFTLIVPPGSVGSVASAASPHVPIVRTSPRLAIHSARGAGPSAAAGGAGTQSVRTGSPSSAAIHAMPAYRGSGSMGMLAGSLGRSGGAHPMLLLGTSPARGGMGGGIGALLPNPSSRQRAASNAAQLHVQMHSQMHHLQQWQMQQMAPPSNVHAPPPGAWGADMDDDADAAHYAPSTPGSTPSSHATPATGADHAHHHSQQHPQHHWGPPDGPSCPGGTEGAVAPLASMPLPLRAYLVGQLSNVLKLGIWWTVFGPLLLSLFHGHIYGLALTRAAFNTALMLASPIAAVLVERVSVRRILLVTVSVRALIYSVLLPLLWVLLETDWVAPCVAGGSHGSGSHGAHATAPLLICFFVLIFIDGLAVAASNVVDIDCDGAGLVARQHSLPIRPGLAAQFARWHERTFEAAMIFLAPMLAVAAQLVCSHWNSIASKNVEDDPSAMPASLSGPVLLFALGAVFAVSSVVSLLCYACCIPGLSSRAFRRSMRAEEQYTEDGTLVFVQAGALQAHNAHAQLQTDALGRSMSTEVDTRTGGDLELALASGASASASGTATPATPVTPSSSVAGDELTGAADLALEPLSLRAEVSSTWSLLLTGGRICWRTPALRHRLWLLSIQTALEDAVVCVLIPSICVLILQRSLSPGAGCFYGQSNVLSVGAIAVGKAGGLVLSKLRTEGWISGETLSRWADMSSSPFIALTVAASSLVLLLFPLASWVLQPPGSSLWEPQGRGARDAGVIEVPVEGGTAVLAVLLVLGASALFFALSSLPRFLLASGIQATAETVAAEAEERRALTQQWQYQQPHATSPTDSQEGAGNTTGGEVHPDLGQDEEEEVDVSRALFGFVAACLTCVDSVVLLLLAAVFAATSNGAHELYNRGLVVTGALLLLHALVTLMASCCGCGRGAHGLAHDDPYYTEDDENMIAHHNPYDDEGETSAHYHAGGSNYGPNGRSPSRHRHSTPATAAAHVSPYRASTGRIGRAGGMGGEGSSDGSGASSGFEAHSLAYSYTPSATPLAHDFSHDSDRTAQVASWGGAAAAAAAAAKAAASSSAAGAGAGAHSRNDSGSNYPAPQQLGLRPSSNPAQLPPSARAHLQLHLSQRPTVSPSASRSSLDGDLDASPIDDSAAASPRSFR